MVRFHPDPHNMSDKYETFFTTVGCMDGRAQGVVADFGRKNFRVMFEMAHYCFVRHMFLVRTIYLKIPEVLVCFQIQIHRFPTYRRL